MYKQQIKSQAKAGKLAEAIQTMKEIEALVIKPKKSTEEKIKWQIETDLFYLFECKCNLIALL